MLMPLPATLRRLVAEYETLAATRDPGQRLSDLEYTLCVSTGTREIGAALEAARSYLAQAAATPVGRTEATVPTGPRPGTRTVRRPASLPSVVDAGARVGNG